MIARALRRKLLLSTATLVATLGGYGRAYATCDLVVAPNVFECSGAQLTAQQNFLVDNAEVSTVADFGGVVTTDNVAINIQGRGALSFTDSYNAPLTAAQDAIRINATGNVVLGAPGSVAINTNGVLTGGNNGIFVRNYFGSGAVDIVATGDVVGTNGIGIDVRNSGTGLSIETASVSGGTRGIDARNLSSGELEIVATGDVVGTSREGIYARNAGTDFSIETASVTGGWYGIRANNFGNGAFDIVATGGVTGTNYDGILVQNEGTALSIEAASVSGGENGVRGVNRGSGALDIVVTGDVTGTLRQGIYAVNSAAGTDLSIETASVSGGTYGIRAINRGNGALDIVVTGDVTGNSRDGILAQHLGGGPIRIVDAAAARVTSNGVGAGAFAIQTVGGATDLTVAGTLNGGAGGAVQFDQVAALDDRLALVTGAVVNGNAFAGPGTDTLILEGSGNGSFNVAQLVDFEAGEKTGGGQWELTGSNTQIANFTVDAGRLQVNGALPNAAFDVTGGTLGGGGTVGPTTVASGGIFAPGNSIGTMTVNGSFTLNPGAVYEVEVNAKGQGDKVIVNGTVNLTGATLRVLAENGNYKPRTDYVIIDNDGTDAVVGTFGKVTTNLAFLTPVVIYNGGDGNDVVLTLLILPCPNGGGGGGSVSFCSAAKTYNQRQVAKALNRFPTDNPLFLAVLTQTASGARQAFDALSGEIHATVAGTLADDSRYVREAVLGRLLQASSLRGAAPREIAALSAGGPQVVSLDSQAYALGYGFDGKSLVAPESAPLAFWTRAYGAWGDFNGDGNAATADRDLGGFVSGMDAQVSGSWRAGLATGASFSNVSVSDRYSSADVESYTLGGYLGGMASVFALRGGGMWAWNDIDTSRAVVFPGFFERQKASYDADTGQLFGEVAYPTQVGGMAVEPFGGLAFVSIDTDSFRERGGALASLRGVDLDQDVGYSTLGLRAATTMHFGGMQIVPHISAAWQHAFDDVTPGAALSFASTGIGFGIEGVPLAEDTALIDAGLDFALGANTTAGVSYTGQFGDGVSDNGVKGRFTWLF